MAEHDDEPLEFDFFDEPETVEATQRRRLPRLERSGGRGGGDRPPRPPLRTPTGLVPLARLAGLIAIAIVIVVGLVFWVGSCQGKSKTEEYSSYADKVRAIAKTDNSIGVDFSQKLLASAPKQSELEQELQRYAQQEQQAFTQAQEIRPPGPLRTAHQNLVDSLQLRYQGFSQLADILARANLKTSASGAAAQMTRSGELLTASDVVWRQLYQQPATQTLVEQGVKGVAIPSSTLIQNPDIVGSRSFGDVILRLTGASTGGSATGKHGDGIVGTRVTPQNTDLSPSSATTVKVSPDLAFEVTVENSGNFQEVNVPVTLTIDAGGSPIERHETITEIAAGARKTVTFSGFNLPASAFGAKATIKVLVKPVSGEVNTTNNRSTYTVFFTLS
ncbi:MAG TPA: hypothetical protein VFA56_04025 [Gaiellaceae bacterium]|nr:hypothetical protein [Gaiellaceae bacterium]